MKLANFQADRGPELGLVKGERLIPVSRLAPGLARDMIDLIARFGEIERDLRALERDGTATLALAEVSLLAPVQHPSKIMAIGLNYADHIAEAKAKIPEHQLWFSKMPSSINGPSAPIQIPRAGQAVDYEAELVAVIGKGGRHIAKADAPKAIFGYCCGNDVTERGWQMRTPQWVLGKSFDTHAPIGPWITTADEVSDVHALSIRCLVNGELRQSSNTRNLVFNVFDQVEHLSKAMTLCPGDLIFTGTPGGVGAAMQPPRFLRSGDRVRVEIETLGAIEASCIDE